MFNTGLYFFAALFILITFHEAGHFVAARLLGVKVLRFSFGFGRVLFSRTDKRGTEYAFSLIPLGGYVKLLDEVTGDVPTKERHLAFNTQPVLSRILIILAGPFANFLLAFIAFGCVLVKGIPAVKPVLGAVVQKSAAQSAGFQKNDEFLSINGKKVASWSDVRYALMPHMGKQGQLRVKVLSRTTHSTRLLMLPIRTEDTLEANADILINIGLMPLVPKVPMRIGHVSSNSPAFEAGLSKGDKLLAVDGQNVKDWQVLITYLKAHPKKLVQLDVERKGLHKKISVQLRHGALGVQSEKPDWPSDMLFIKREPIGHAFIKAFNQTYLLTETMVKWIGMMLTGELPLKHLSGPVGMYEGARDAAFAGFVYYLSFLGIISIGLGIVNLLPIPLLDGGQLTYILIECLTGRPLSQRAKALSVSLGVFVLVSLTLIALKNDITRIIGLES